MYEPHQQHLLDLRENSGFGSDPKSWLSGDDLSRTLSSLSAAAATASAAGTVDRVLFNDLVEMVPLVQSLIWIINRVLMQAAGRRATLPTKNNRDPGEKDQNNPDGCADNFSILSSRSLLPDKDREELMTLRDQVEGLKGQLSEKDELLKSAELSKHEMASLHTKFDELENEAAEKDSMIKSTQLQLSDLKIKLADKQAAVEKLQWEVMTSNKNVGKLQEDLERVQGEVSSFVLLIEGLTRNEFSDSAGDYDVVPYSLDQSHELDYLNEMEMQKLEAAREAYTAAVLAAKEKQDEESIAAAARARHHLQSIVLKQS
ncbi:hypothetical protein RD792_014941 [Penstemon davidsonii]|uniref:Protein MICROTUBULE BINDING PROTEIN 2C n=1 Tax=Penstemon davidsonii TaxID=160366 RepID=A0ABR0CQP9_9LAMI|nr:hypothetical protein RD792_014941 [Penstemon davidsonii]